MMNKPDGIDRPAGSGTHTPAQGLAGLDIGGKAIVRLSLLELLTAHKPVAEYVQDRNPSPAPSADTSILPIVTSQRDRFRQRNAELEEELRKQFETISDLRAEIKSLQADNLKLYEKVRYMGSYRTDGGGGGGGGGGSSMAGPSSGSAGMLNGVMRDEVGKYKDKYDESLNPFEAFKGRVGVSSLQKEMVS